MIDKEGEKRIINEYSGLIKKIAREIAGYYRRWNEKLIDEDDLKQEGYIGLIKAWRKYDPKEGPFRNYAVLYIKGYILSALRKEPIIRIPAYKKFLRKRVYEIAEEHNGKVSVKEIAEEMRNKGEFCSADTIIESLKGVSYVQSLDENENIVGKVEDIETSLYLTEVLNLELKNLLPEERKVLTAFYKNNLSIRAVEEELGLPRKKIKQIISKANRKLTNRKLKKQHK
ncbi:MAG: hypothetical protein DRP18_03005 [Candidatus Aenigmatarchaeota archaeon]|nr:MAG: hypothetical protein DRP18_03005 [Candidatus Aenigmarchaeota archaeon]